jgi:hypothetical protein
MTAPTSNIILRVLMVESEHGRSSIFSVDVDEREYWITARHTLTGIEDGPPYGPISDNLELRLLNAGSTSNRLLWRSINFAGVNPDDEHIDVVVLAASTPILDIRLPSPAADSDGAVFGGDCRILGFANGGGWRAPVSGRGIVWLPFVKHCTISAHEVDKGTGFSMGSSIRVSPVVR